MRINTLIFNERVKKKSAYKIGNYIHVAHLISLTPFAKKAQQEVNTQIRSKEALVNYISSQAAQN
jgi:hypothetical protein